MCYASVGIGHLSKPNKPLPQKGEEISSSGGFDNLNTQSYEDILEGSGFGLEGARNSIELAHTNCVGKPQGLVDGCYSLCRRVV